MAEWTEGEIEGNGITIHYHRTGSGIGPTLVLLHGITDNGLCWTRVARDLEDSYDVLMPDARGHGRSGRLETGFSIDLLAGDTAALIRALNPGRTYLWGHSMGAATAAVLAATDPDLVRVVVLEDPPLGDETPAEQTAGEAARAQQYFQALRQQPREERMARVRTENPAWVEEEIVPWAISKEETVPDIMAHRGVLGRYPWREVLARITCPVLLVTGDPERGAIVTPETARAVESLVPNSRVVRIDGAGHCIHRDRYDETMAAVRAFLTDSPN